MRIQSILSGVVLTAGLMLAGCGGVEPTEEAQQPDLATRKDQLPPCSGTEQYSRVFYSDPGFTNEVGRWRCYCGEGSAWVSGQWQGAPYSREEDVLECY
ncbi:hypothetical protein [Corallococcus caeni]|uniref:Lipoprotein n=1 Tax=Corallococcus caeni TaxID=3082388 RepID=A0ABQ6R3X8_9BACT|nr:hypothetical protein ASNO1_72830 [Corallococcus sp. NO1]